MRAAEWLLFAACAGLVVAGPAMAYQEFAKEGEAAAAQAQADARASLTERPQDAPEVDHAYREAWRWPVFALVVVSGIAGSLLAVRVARRRRWRAVSGRLLGLLLAGMTLIDLAYLLDVQWAYGASFRERGWSVVWLYPLGALLVGGSMYRLTELEARFGSDAPPAPVLSRGLLARAGEAPDDAQR